MKKTVTFIAAALVIGSLFLASCGSSRPLCPAYPAAPYNADVEEANDDPAMVLITEEQETL